MSHHGAWCEPGSFNFPTTLMNKTCDYAKRLQESTDPCKYLLDIRPEAEPCMMTGENLQGYAGSARQPPPTLVDLESRLRRSPDAVNTAIGPLHDKTPTLPAEFQRTINFKDCQRPIGTVAVQHRLRSQMPNYAPSRTDIVLERRKQVDFAGMGRNTRQEMKDAYREHQKKKYASRSDGVYVPTTALDCVNGSQDLRCVHVTKTGSPAAAAAAVPGAVSGSGTSSGLAAGLNISTAASGTGPAIVPISSSGAATGGTGLASVAAPSFALSGTKGNLNVPLWQGMADLGRAASKNVEFYGWKNPCA